MSRAEYISRLGNEANVFVSSNNNVGIGSTIPTSKLDVGGTTSSRFSGSFTGSVNSTGISTFSVITGVSTIGVSTVYVSTINDGPISGARNRIINGDMRIDQRNAGASLTIGAATSTYTVDRWQAFGTQASKFSVQGNAGSVTPPVGFSSYLGATSLSAYSAGSAEVFYLQQPIEGLNVSDLSWGTSSARPVTLSFWVRSSLTGVHGGSIQNSANNRSYPFTFTINSANTWEFETIVIPGDTTGTWLTNNLVGLRVNLGLGCGSGASGTAGVWAASDFKSATGAVSVVGTNGATYYVTGVQLEAGTIATPFERRSYGAELALCQRYFGTYQGGFYVNSQASSFNYGPFYTPVSMRVTPTATLLSNNFIAGASAVSFSSQNIGYVEISIQNNGVAGYTGARPTFTLNAEL